LGPLLPKITTKQGTFKSSISGLVVNYAFSMYIMLNVINFDMVNFETAAFTPEPIASQEIKKTEDEAHA